MSEKILRLVLPQICNIQLLNYRLQKSTEDIPRSDSEIFRDHPRLQSPEIRGTTSAARTKIAQAASCMLVAHGSKDFAKRLGGDLLGDLGRFLVVLFEMGPLNLEEALGEKYDQIIYCTEFDTWKWHCVPDISAGFRLFYLFEILLEDCRTSWLLGHQWENIDLRLLNAWTNQLKDLLSILLSILFSYVLLCFLFLGLRKKAPVRGRILPRFKMSWLTMASANVWRCAWMAVSRLAGRLGAFIASGYLGVWELTIHHVYG